eukprot:TRINITY_DN1212_c0_g2_i1.p1 TRINITY_DN1212_c0_g2~~TRINITY_DN1212_c0_g2_i1.p1  ORF type:complete len:504 (+),score=155.02 TRINITY_DN1212_c0_g2_i1:84-1595(+)
MFFFFFFFFQAEDGIRDAQESRGLGDVYKRQEGSKAGSEAQDASEDDQEAEHSTWGKKGSILADFVNTIVCPLVLMLWAPTFGLVLTYITTNPDIITVEKYIAECADIGVYSCVYNACFFGVDPDSVISAIQFLLGFNLVALALFFIPGPEATGPITEKGHTPVYIDNGMLHCVIFTALFFVGSSEFGCNLFPLSIIWDNFAAGAFVLNAFGIIFCCFLLLKGWYFPSGPDSGASGHGFLFDYYWGGELYPRILGVDVKQFINCRFSMTFWMLSGVSFAAASYHKHGQADPGLVLCALSVLVYLFKFFYWEIGYMRSIDIIVDRAGFYETWGCIFWVPTLYTCHARATVLSPSGLSWTSAGIIFFFSILGVVCNFLADNQRQLFREAGGDCLVWGSKPRFIKAKYSTRSANGKVVVRESLLLASGWWGVARHFHYFFELLAAWCWALLCGLGTNLVALSYPIFLTVLLVHRAQRDQEKCEGKYGKYYRQYMEMVPYKIIPGIY